MPPSRRIVTSDPEVRQQIFPGKGTPHATSNLLGVALRHAVAELQKCLRELHNAETNLNFGDPLRPHPEGRTLVERHNARVKIVTQEERSR
jgi:hypothetical protein